MNIDTLTGLPIVSAGYFFRVVIKSKTHMDYSSALCLMVQLRKKFFLGLGSRLILETMVYRGFDGSEAVLAISKDKLPHYAGSLWEELQLRRLKRINFKKGKKLLCGDYPPKKL